MIGSMAQVHITEAEAARDFHAVLEKVRDGAEVVIDHGGRPVAVIRSLQGHGRPLDEAIAIAEAFETHLGFAPVPDADFARDVQEGIDAHRGPLEISTWHPNG